METFKENNVYYIRWFWGKTYSKFYTVKKSIYLKLCFRNVVIINLTTFKRKGDITQTYTKQG